MSVGSRHRTTVWRPALSSAAIGKLRTMASRASGSFFTCIGLSYLKTARQLHRSTCIKTSRRRAIVREILLLSGALLLVAGASGAQEKVNQKSRILEDFGKRVADYVKLHKAARSQVQALKPTTSPEAIEHHEHQLAHRMRESRRGARTGE